MHGYVRLEDGEVNADLVDWVGAEKDGSGGPGYYVRFAGGGEKMRLTEDAFLRLEDAIAQRRVLSGVTVFTDRAGRRIVLDLSKIDSIELDAGRVRVNGAVFELSAESMADLEEMLDCAAY